MLVHLNPTYETLVCNGDSMQYLGTDFFNILCQQMSASRRLEALDV